MLVTLKTLSKKDKAITFHRVTDLAEACLLASILEPEGESQCGVFINGEMVLDQRATQWHASQAVTY